MFLNTTVKPCLVWVRTVPAVMVCCAFCMVQR
jgi:hypothetical protein